MKIKKKNIKIIQIISFKLKKNNFYELIKNEFNIYFFQIDLSNNNYIIYFRLIVEKDINEKIISIKEENRNIKEFKKITNII